LRQNNFRRLLKTTGWIWIFGGTVGGIFSSIELIRILAKTDFSVKSDSLSMLLAIMFSLIVLFTGRGLLLLKKWARRIGLFQSTVLILYCITFILLVSTEFGILSLMVIIALLIIGSFSFYTILAGRNN